MEHRKVICKIKVRMAFFLSEELCTIELKLQALRFFHNVFVFTLVSCFKRYDVLNRSKIPRNNINIYNVESSNMKHQRNIDVTTVNFSLVI